MGLLHLLVLRAVFPETRIVVAEPDRGRREIARQLGADAAVAPKRIVEASGNARPSGGADAVFETAGGQAAFDLLHRGVLDPTRLVTHRLPLDRAAEAVELCRRRAALKVLLHP